MAGRRPGGRGGRHEAARGGAILTCELPEDDALDRREDGEGLGAGKGAPVDSEQERNAPKGLPVQDHL